MGKGQGVRWAVLLSSLTATVAAIFWPMTEDAPSPVRASAPPTPSPASVTQPAATTESPREWLAAEENPFAPRGWIASTTAPEPTRTVAPVLAAEAPPPPPTPLPFRFLGSMSDAEDRVVYLGQGEQLVSAHQGDVIDGHYKVTSISASQIEFEDTASGLRQLLPLPVQDK